MGLLSHAWHAHLFRANWASAKQQEEWSAIQFLEGFTSTLPCEADAEGSGWWPCRWSIVSYHLLLPLGLCHWTQVGPSHCRRKLRKLGAWCGRGANPKGHTVGGLRFEAVWRLRRVKSWVEQQVLHLFSANFTRILTSSGSLPNKVIQVSRMGSVRFLLFARGFPADLQACHRAELGQTWDQIWL